jgi:predicted DNA-binding transcriptional regulator AlpA
MKLLGRNDLHNLGITYSREHLRKLILAGQFPVPIPIGAGRRQFWDEGEIHQYIADRTAQRDAKVTARREAKNHETPAPL